VTAIGPPLTHVHRYGRSYSVHSSSISELLAHFVLPVLSPFREPMVRNIGPSLASFGSLLKRGRLAAPAMT
jgi:hypothetical protein